MNDQEMIVRLFVDSGSQRSYLIAGSIGLQVPTDSLSVPTLGGKPVKPRDCKECDSLSLLIKGEPTEAVEMETFTIPKIGNPLGSCQDKSSEQPSPTR